MYERIAAGVPSSGIPPWGQAAWGGWDAWNTAPAMLSCPSDSYYKGAAGHNYAFCVGDHISNICWNTSNRGIFSQTVGVSIADIRDGTANTIMMSERYKDYQTLQTASARSVEMIAGEAMGFATNALINNPIQCYTGFDGGFVNSGQSWKYQSGSNWHDGQAESVAFNTVLPPNGPSCGEGTNSNRDSGSAILPPSSRHPGGVNCVIADGSVHFISNTIDTGNLAANAAQPTSGYSLYGVWGALGSKAGNEAVQMP